MAPATEAPMGESDDIIAPARDVISTYTTAQERKPIPVPPDDTRKVAERVEGLYGVAMPTLTLDMMRDEQRQQLQALQEQRAQAKALQQMPAVDPQLQALLLQNARQLQAMQLQNAQLLQSVQRAQAAQAAEESRAAGEGGAYSVSEEYGLLHVGAFDEPTIKLVSELDENLLGTSVLVGVAAQGPQRRSHVGVGATRVPRGSASGRTSA